MHIRLSLYNNLRGRYLTATRIERLLVIALIIFGVSASHAQTGEQGTIQGTVIDKKREKPIVEHQMTLTIHKADSFETQETLTDENGNYRFRDLPIDPTLHYTVSILYEDTDYTEKDLVLSTWSPNITLDFNIGAFTNDTSQIQVKRHTFIIRPPPADHAPDGAVTVIEAIEVENRDSLPFQIQHGGQTVGLHLALPKQIEGFQPHSPTALTINQATNEAILTTPLPPGESQLGYTYIFHVERNKLDLSRGLNFDTAEFLFFIQEGISLVPNTGFFGPPKREQIHNSVYLIYQSTASGVSAAGTAVDLAFKVNTGAARGAISGQTSNLGQLILIVVAAALTGGFFVAALFKIRTVNNTEPNTDDAAVLPDEGWIRKLNPEDREHVRIARLEFITHLDDKYEGQEISERVYKRLRREQTERLTTLLEQQKRGNNA